MTHELGTRKRCSPGSSSATYFNNMSTKADTKPAAAISMLSMNVILEEPVSQDAIAFSKLSCRRVTGCHGMSLA